MQENSEQILKKLITEYETKQTEQTPKAKVGDVFLSIRDNALYICYGRVNGNTLWKKIEDQNTQQ